MLKFWRNPEFVRHARAELRSGRILTVAAITVTCMVLLGMIHWSHTSDDTHEFLRHYYLTLLWIQFIVLGVWCAATCGQSVARERELKTYDFLKTTRLTSSELMVGKLLGVPILGYFTIGCTLPVSIACGLLGGYGLRAVCESVVLLAAYSLFMSLFGLWCSMLMDKSLGSIVGLLGLFSQLIPLAFRDSPLPGAAAFSVLPALFQLHAAQNLGTTRASLFGFSVPLPVMTIFLFALFGAWFVLMLARNLKKDREQIRLLSRWEAVGLVFFLNVLFYALLNPHRLELSDLRFAYTTPDEISRMAVVFNAVLIFLVGIAILAPHEQLRVWWRQWKTGQAAYVSDTGLPWPWLIPGAVIAFALLAAEALGMGRFIPMEKWQIGRAAAEFLVFLVFNIRDISFLQWCLLTRMRRPVLKGFLLLWLYQATAGVVVVVSSVVSRHEGEVAANLLAPYGLLNGDLVFTHIPVSVFAGIAFQIAITGMILWATVRRLDRHAVAMAAA
jgi:hypothetical protein